MTASKYMKALKSGSEIVIVSNDKNSNSSVFYLDSDGIICTFSRFFGLMRRTDITIEQAIEHFQNMEKECKVFIRGYMD